jgi:hypothetical protein
VCILCDGGFLSFGGVVFFFKKSAASREKSECIVSVARNLLQHTGVTLCCTTTGAEMNESSSSLNAFRNSSFVLI